MLKSLVLHTIIDINLSERKKLLVKNKSMKFEFSKKKQKIANLFTVQRKKRQFAFLWCETCPKQKFITFLLILNHFFFSELFCDYRLISSHLFEWYQLRINYCAQTLNAQFPWITKIGTFSILVGNSRTIFNLAWMWTQPELRATFSFFFFFRCLQLFYHFECAKCFSYMHYVLVHD